MKSLAVICIVKNEENFLATALASAKKIATEIVVVDSGSTDKTVAIAKQFTDKVFQQAWLGYGPQKNFAMKQTACDYILHIDADEEITDELAQEIRSILEQPKFKYYWLKLITVFLNKPLKHLAGNNMRLFSRTDAEWNDKKVHEQVVRSSDKTVINFAAPDSGRAKAYLMHHSHYQTIAGYLERQEKYSTNDAEEMLKTGFDRMGKKVDVNPRNVFSKFKFLFHRALKQFVRRFFKQQGVLDGWQGWLWCFFSAQYEYKMCRKYLNLLNSPN